MNAYNPQNWGMHGPAVGVHVRHGRASVMGGPLLLGDMTGMEASLPSPPPPYFAMPAVAANPPPMNASQFRLAPRAGSFGPQNELSSTSVRSTYSPTSAYESAQGVTLSRSAAATVNNSPHIPQQISPTSFPPPPSNDRDSSTSRARGVINNLSAWANRNKAPDTIPRRLSSNEMSSQQWQEDNSSPAVRPSLVSIQPSSENPLVPPTARRAISVGYIIPPPPLSREASRSRQISLESAPWEPGMPLPPPPPGPPPTLRSHSLGPALPCSSNIQTPIGPCTTPPRPPHRGTALGSVPPTPADWIDGEERQLPPSNDVEADEGPPLVGMLQLHARRESSTKGIRERRYESRARSRDAHAEMPQDLWENRFGVEEAKPADLTFKTDSNLVGRRRHASKPTSSPTTLHLLVPTSDSNTHVSGTAYGAGRANSDIGSKWSSNQAGPSLNRFMPTPPFSPESPNEGSGFTGAREPLAKFLRLSLDRYRNLIEKERRAATDSERLGLFAEFVVKESRIHRARFTNAFESISNELLSTASDMWLLDDPPAPSKVSSPEEDIYSEPQQPKLSPLSTRNLSENYKYEPVLSPVLSTTASNFPEDSDGRGRTASRWWEASELSDSVNGSVSRKIERSARESKYMGVPYYDEQFREDFGTQASTNNVAWHTKTSVPVLTTKIQTSNSFDENITPTWTPRTAVLTSPDVLTPKAGKLDVSRLVTLPPPYPRRYPALSKSHPRLAAARASLRRISNQGFLNAVQAYRMSIIATGDKSGAVHWDTEIDALVVEAGKCLGILEHDAHMAESCGAGRAQEEGDAEPELLERLTLMKWVFEAREHLLREQAALGHTINDSPATDVYDTTATTSITAVRSQAKQSLRRHESFLATIYALTTNGVQCLAAAFWDIAPTLSSLIQDILSYENSSVLSTALDIPLQERAANPAYNAHPMRYLQEVLEHAETSTRQFIDSQVNLFCLRHEVACAAAKARRTAARTQQQEQNGKAVSTRLEADSPGGDQDANLTRELQSRVAVVEEQWASALGNSMTACNRMVSQLLRESGGWEEDVDELDRREVEVNA